MQMTQLIVATLIMVSFL